MSKNGYTKVALDCGNANVKITPDNGQETVFVHALHELSAHQIEMLKYSGGEAPDVFEVNGTYYSAGDQAIKDGAGAALLGEQRYTRNYYGVLAAISLHRALPANAKNIFMFSSHTPKDKIYRAEIRESVRGDWLVSSQGVAKKFGVLEVQGYDEPTGAFRHAVFSDDGLSMRGARNLREGACLIIDIGGFTVGLSVAENGKVDYDSSITHVGGILDVLAEFEQLIRSKYRLKLKGANALKPDRLREAFATGVYRAGGTGDLDVRDCVTNAANPLLHSIEVYVSNYGGIAAYDSMLLAGGGTTLFEGKLRERIKHPYMYPADENRAHVQRATARGGLKTMRALEAKGKLWQVAK